MTPSMDRAALRGTGKSLPAGALEARVQQLADALERARPRVLGLVADNGIDWVLADLAALAREHNDANVLALGARLIGPDMAKHCVSAFLGTQFAGGRHCGGDLRPKLGLLAERPGLEGWTQARGPQPMHRPLRAPR